MDPGHTTLSDQTGRRAVTAFFDDRAAAQTAIDDLVAAGVARGRIILVEGGPEPVAGEAVPSRDKGLWDAVKDLFRADEDRHAYGEGLRRGGFLLSVRTEAADQDGVIGILDREGAVDLDERQSGWELEGWDPVRAAADFGHAPAPGATPGSGAASVTGDRGLGAGPQRSGPAAVRAAGPSRLRTYIDASHHHDPDDRPV